MKNKTFYSGGQSGVDRAVLLFCKEFNLKYTGYCPKGRLAEDGKIPFYFNLKETNTNDVKERTRQNIENSELTIFLFDKNGIDSGTQYAINYCKSINKKFIVINIDLEENFDFKRLNENIINIVGARESNAKGIETKTYNFLKKSLILT